MSGYLRVLDAEIDLDLPSAKLHTLNTKDRWSILSWSVTKMSIHRIELSSHGRRYSNSATPPQRRRELHSLTICRLLDLLKSLAAYFYLKLQPHPQPHPPTPMSISEFMQFSLQPQTSPDAVPLSPSPRSKHDISC